MPVVSKSYAQGLYDADPDNAEKILSALNGFAAIEVDSPDLRSLMDHPYVSLASKKETISSLLTKAPTIAQNFLFLLLDKGRLKLLPDILRAYQEVYEQATGVLDVHVISAIPLDTAEIERLRTIYEKQSGKRVVIRTTIDKTLIGGLKVYANGILTDNSIESRLQKMKIQLA
jgi:F-type H+-transporting ATPase subunit delta